METTDNTDEPSNGGASRSKLLWRLKAASLTTLVLAVSLIVVAVRQSSSPSAVPQVQDAARVTTPPSFAVAPSESVPPAPSPVPVVLPSLAPIVASSQAPVIPPSPAPVLTSSPAPVVAPSPSSFCNLDTLACPSNDRFGQAPNFELRVGEAICNFPYIFGWSATDPVFQFKNCDTNETRLVWDGRQNPQYQDLSFRLWSNATLTIHNDEQLVWSADSIRKTQLVPQCLSNPKLDCPYIHLHANGDVVINYIDSAASTWKARQAHDVYFDIYPSAQTTMLNVKNKNYCAQIMPDLVCLGDRLGHGERFRLGSNKALCNQDFMLGWTTDGVLELRNCATNDVSVVYDTGSFNGDDDYYFVLMDDASLEIRTTIGTTNALWSRDFASSPIVSRACSDDPLLKCPYIHLRTSGDLVLNFATDDNVTAPWLQRNVNRAYTDFFV